MDILCGITLRALHFVLESAIYKKSVDFIRRLLGFTLNAQPPS